MTDTLAVSAASAVIIHGIIRREKQMDKYIKFGDLLEYLRNRNDEARRCGHEETYFDLLTIIDGLKNVDTVPAIPYQWIVDYLAWLKDIGGYGLSDARAIQSMIIKWKMEHTDGCGPDYCKLGGEG